MKVISWNLLHGQPLPPPSTPLPAEEAARLLTIAGATLSELGVEILGVQEADADQPRSANLSQVEILADALGAKHWAFAPAIMGTPGEDWRALHVNEQVIEDSSGLKPGAKSDANAQPRYGIGLISTIPVKKWHRIELGRSRIGLPLVIPAGGDSGEAEAMKRIPIRFIYVRDEPRVALAAELENGFTVAVTHLSFVPFVNYYQLIKVRRWVKALPGNPIIMGDLNLGWALPVRGTHWRSLRTMNTYPSWGSKIQFDYITAHVPDFGERTIEEIEIPDLGISDHSPIGVEIL
jgi:endonuclease/exonuclease/phosphatase family metal-dependent hydrolase